MVGGCIPSVLWQLRIIQYFWVRLLCLQQEQLHTKAFNPRAHSLDLLSLEGAMFPSSVNVHRGSSNVSLVLLLPSKWKVTRQALRNNRSQLRSAAETSTETALSY